MSDGHGASRERARRLFRARVRRALDNADEAFRGEYADAITQLLGLSREEIDAITPDATDLATYDQLIAVVKEASRLNIAQAELKSRIVNLGRTAVAIARKVPALSGIL